MLFYIGFTLNTNFEKIIDEILEKYINYVGDHFDFSFLDHTTGRLVNGSRTCGGYGYGLKIGYTELILTYACDVTYEDKNYKLDVFAAKLKEMRENQFSKDWVEKERNNEKLNTERHNLIRNVATAKHNDNSNIKEIYQYQKDHSTCYYHDDQYLDVLLTTDVNTLNDISKETKQTLIETKARIPYLREEIVAAKQALDEATVETKKRISDELAPLIEEQRNALLGQQKQEKSCNKYNKYIYLIGNIVIIIDIIMKFFIYYYGLSFFF